MIADPANLEFRVDPVDAKVIYDYIVHIVSPRTFRAFEEECKGAFGGIFRIHALMANRETVELGSFPFGVIPAEKGSGRTRKSLEKIERLAENHFEHGHISSWQSRDPDADKWGGAITAIIPADQSPTGFDQPAIISSSGPPEPADEYLVTSFAYRKRWVNRARLEQIAMASGNRKLMDFACHG